MNRLICALVLLPTAAAAQRLVIVSGDGQMVRAQFLTQTPLTLEARDANNNPMPNVAISWTITQTLGTLNGAQTMTDAKGRASTNVVGSSPLSGTSFDQGTIAATAGSSSVTFYLTTVQTILSNGQLAPPPQITMVNPTYEVRAISGKTGQILPAAIQVRVTSGGLIPGAPMPHVGMRMVDGGGAAQPVTQCTAPGGYVLTDANGLASCDLALGPQAGSYTLQIAVGDYLQTPTIRLEVQAGVSCSYLLSATGAVFGPAAAQGSVSVTTPASTCTWTASTAAPWIALTSGQSSSGSNILIYQVARNTGAARAGTIEVAGNLYSVTQNSPQLTITATSPLPLASRGVNYAANIGATGGTPPYAWQVTSGALPPGLSLGATNGLLGGTPTTAGLYGFTIAATDASNGTDQKAFALEVSSSATPPIAITNTAFGAATAGQPYQVVLTSSGGCANPFSRPPAFVLTAGALPDGLAVKQISDRTYGIGGTPTKAGAFTFTLTVTDPCGSAASGIFGIAVGTAITPPAPMLANPSGLFFTAKAGDPKPADQQISLTAVREQLAYSAAAQTDSGVNWLSLGNASGVTPGTLIVGLASSYTLLAPGVYNGTVLIVSQATNSPVSVTVQLTVQPATPTLQVSPAALTFTYDYGRSLTPQSIVVASSSVQVKYQVTTSTANGGSWLNAVATGSDTPGSVQVSVNPAGLTTGRYQGAVTISSAAGTLAVTVTLNVSPPPSLQVNPASVAFSFRPGDAPAAIQTVAVTSSTGAAVSFTAVASSPANWLFAQVTGGTTPGSIVLTVNPAGLDFGSYGGTVRVQSGDPAIAPLVFNVTVTIGRPQPMVGALANAASFDVGGIAPGEIVTVFGSNFGPAAIAGLRFDASGFVAAATGDTQVFFDGVAAPMIYSVAGQASAIVPYGVAGKASVRVQVDYLGTRSAGLDVRVVASAPGLFNAVLNQDGSVNGPGNPAEAGSIVVLFATGEGVTSPPSVDGAITGSSLPKPVLPVSVTIGGRAAEILYAGAAPGLVAGVMQVNARVPADAPSGAQGVVLAVGEGRSRGSVAVAVK